MEEQEQEQSNSKIWVATTVLFGLLLIIAIVVGLLLGNFNGIDKKTLAEEYIKIDDLTFYHLPTKIQAEYQKVASKQKIVEQNSTVVVDKNSTSFDMSKYILKAEYDKLKKEFEEFKIKSDKNISIKSVVKEVLSDKKDILVKENDVEMGKSFDTNSKVIQCLDMNVGDFRMSKNCFDRLHKEIAGLSNKNSFEVIGFVDINDFKVLSHIKDNNEDILTELNLTKEDLDKLFEVANSGLGLKRANEAVWELKQKFGFDANIKSASYVITTYQKRGFAVKIK